MADVAAVLNILLTANATQANAQLAKTQANLTATQRKAEVTGAAMKKAMLGVGVAAAGAAVALYKIGEEFDDAYDKIRTGTGATGKELKRLEQSFRDVVADVPASFDDASTAVADLNTRLGLAGKPLEKIAKQVTELSRITGTDVKGNVEGISKAFNDWDVGTKKMGRTLDGFYRLSQNSGVAVSDLTTAVQQFGSPLRQLGYSLGEAAAMWATFVRAGVNTQTMVPGLKLAIASLTAPTDDLRAKMDQLGIAVGKPDVALRQILDLLGSGSTLSQIEKTTLAMEVFGKRAGADMAEAIKQGRFEVDDMLDTFRNGDDTIRKSGRETMDLAEQWQRFTNLLKLKVEPIAAKVFGGLSKLMKEVTRAFKRDGFQGLLDLLTEKVNDALPKIADAGAKIGLALMKGIADAFWNSSILGKLFIAGTFMRIVGGAGVFGKIGAAMGTRMLTGMSTTIADGKGLKGPASRFGTAFGGLAGPYVAAMVMSAMAGIEFGKSGWVQENATDITKYTDYLMDRYDLTQKRAERVVNYMKKHPGLGAEESMKAINYKRTFANLFRGFDMTSDKSRDTARDIDKDQNDIGRSLNQSGNKSRRFGEVVSGNFNVLGGVIGDALRTIGNNTNKVLGSLSAERIKFSIEQSEKTGGFHGLQTGGLVPGLQTGALVPGTGSGDKVPLHLGGRLAAMVEPGELVSVANRNATAALMATNAAVPRFAEGGSLDGAHATVSNFVRSLMSKYGGGVGSGLRPGDPGFHGRGLAIDYSPADWAGAAAAVNRAGPSLLEGIYNPGVNGPPAVSWDSGAQVPSSFWGASTWANHLDHIHIAIADGAKVAAGAVAEKIKQLTLTGPDGPLKDMGQAVIDKATKAANAYIAKHAPSQVGLSEGPGIAAKGLPPALQKWNHTFPGAVLQSDPGAWMSLTQMPFNVAAAIAEWAGMPGVTMAQVSKGEGGLRPGSMGDDNVDGIPDGFGWLAITRPYGDSYGVDRYGGYKGMLNPVSNAIVAKGMYDAQGLSAWYGQRFVTDTNAHYTGPLLNKQMGGVIAKLAAGGMVPGLQKGGKSKDGKGKGPGFSVSDAHPYEGSKRLARAREIADRLRGMLSTSGRIAMLDERIANAETLAALATSEAGTELGTGERNKQIGLNTRLLDRLQFIGKRAGAGIGLLDKIDPKGPLGKQAGNLRKRLTGYLTAVAGLTGKGGRILEVSSHINDLQHPDSTSPTAPDTGLQIDLLTTLLQQANQRTALSQAQYKVLAATPVLGAFADGGVAAKGGMYLVGENGPEIASLPGGTQVQPTRTSFGDVQVIVYGDIHSDRRDPVEVVIGDKRFPAAVRQVTRGQARAGGRVLPGRGGA